MADIILQELLGEDEVCKLYYVLSLEPDLMKSF